MSSRQRAADDYAAIRERMEALRKPAEPEEEVFDVTVTLTSHAPYCMQNYGGRTCPSNGLCVRYMADRKPPRCVDFGGQPTIANRLKNGGEP